MNISKIVAASLLSLSVSASSPASAGKLWDEFKQKVGISPKLAGSPFTPGMEKLDDWVDQNIQKNWKKKPGMGIQNALDAYFQRSTKSEAPIPANWKDLETPQKLAALEVALRILSSTGGAAAHDSAAAHSPLRPVNLDEILTAGGAAASTAGDGGQSDDEDEGSSSASTSHQDDSAGGGSGGATSAAPTVVGGPGNGGDAALNGDADDRVKARPANLTLDDNSSATSEAEEGTETPATPPAAVNVHVLQNDADEVGEEAAGNAASAVIAADEQEAGRGGAGGGAASRATPLDFSIFSALCGASIVSSSADGIDVNGVKESHYQLITPNFDVPSHYKITGEIEVAHGRAGVGVLFGGKWKVSPRLHTFTATQGWQPFEIDVSDNKDAQASLVITNELQDRDTVNFKVKGVKIVSQ